MLPILGYRHLRARERGGLPLEWVDYFDPSYAHILNQTRHGLRLAQIAHQKM